MAQIALLGAVLVLTCAALGLWLRARWIKGKLSTLHARASVEYAGQNARLAPKGKKPRLVLIGDSRIAQWPQDFWAQEWEIVNRGIGGETLGQLAQRFQNDALALSPDAIVIESGVNDFVANSFLSESERHAAVSSAAETLRQLAKAGVGSGAKVLVATIIPPARPSVLRRLVHKGALRVMVVSLNSRLTLSDWPPGAMLVDFSQTLGADPSGELPAVYRADTLHINRLAYERLTLAVEETLNAAAPETSNS